MVAAFQKLEDLFPGSDFKGNKPLIKGKRRLSVGAYKETYVPNAKNYGIGGRMS